VLSQSAQAGEDVGFFQMPSWLSRWFPETQAEVAGLGLELEKMASLSLSPLQDAAVKSK
jgi:hypothetical protein